MHGGAVGTQLGASTDGQTQHLETRLRTLFTSLSSPVLGSATNTTVSASTPCCSGAIKQRVVNTTGHQPSSRAVGWSGSIADAQRARDSQSCAAAAAAMHNLAPLMQCG